jgi:hypothetical protein
MILYCTGRETIIDVKKRVKITLVKMFDMASND